MNYLNTKMFFICALVLSTSVCHAHQASGDAYGDTSTRNDAYWSGCLQAATQAIGQALKDPQGSEDGFFLGNYLFKTVERTKEGNKNRCKIVIEYGNNVVFTPTKIRSFQLAENSYRSNEVAWAYDAIMLCAQYSGGYSFGYQAYQPVFSEFLTGQERASVLRKITCELAWTTQAITVKKSGQSGDGACQIAKDAAKIQLEQNCAKDFLTAHAPEFREGPRTKTAGITDPWTCVVSANSYCVHP